MSRAPVPHTPCALAGQSGHRCNWLQACCGGCGRTRQPDEAGWLCIRPLSDTPGQVAVVVCSEACWQSPRVRGERLKAPRPAVGLGPLFPEAAS